MHLVHAQIFGDLFGHAPGVASEHDRLFHAGILEPLDGFLRVRLHHVGDDDMARILAVNGHVNDRADAVAIDERNAVQLHQLAVARQHVMAVHFGGNALAADLLNVFHAAAVDGLAVGLLQALANGMG